MRTLTINRWVVVTLIAALVSLLSVSDLHAQDPQSTNSALVRDQDLVVADGAPCEIVLNGNRQMSSSTIDTDCVGPLLVPAAFWVDLGEEPLDRLLNYQDAFLRAIRGVNAASRSETRTLPAFWADLGEEPLDRLLDYQHATVGVVQSASAVSRTAAQASPAFWTDVGEEPVDRLLDYQHSALWAARDVDAGLRSATQVLAGLGLDPGEAPLDRLLDIQYGIID
jgi:hypothetical protein